MAHATARPAAPWRHRRSAPLACLLGLLLRAQAQIRVMSPRGLIEELSDNGRIRGSTATFGAPFYGDRVLGQLVYGPSLHGNHHCQVDDYDVPSEPSFGGNSDKTRLINIILVRRGNCSFTTKVRVAAEKGAHAVLIADKADSKLTSADMDNIIVDDDGRGGSITIPSVLIAKDVGSRLIDYLAQHHQVVIELSWDHIPKNYVVQMQQWMSSASVSGFKFLKEFAPKRRTLNEVVSFEPRYAVFGMDHADSQVYNELCTDTSGKFCAEDPDGAGLIRGLDVLAEDVRQLCIHQVHKVQRTSTNDLSQGRPGVEYSRQFWDYVEVFHDTCPLTSEGRPENRFSEECSKKLMRQVGADLDKVKACVAENTTVYLQMQRDRPAWSPRALRINGWRYTGILDADLVTRAICSAFTQQPRECESLMKPRDPFLPYKGQSVCTWNRHENQYAPSQEGEPNDQLPLEEAQAKCLRLGPSACGAVTCGTDLLCRTHVSSRLQNSVMHDTTYQPSEACFSERGVTFVQAAFWFMMVVIVVLAGMLLYKRYLKKEMRSILREEVMLEVQAQIGEYSKLSA